MATKGRQRQDSGEMRRDTRRVLSGRKLAVLAVLIMASGVLLFLAVASYDPADQSNADVRWSDLVNVLRGDPQARAKADTTQNWLGLVGAVVAEFFVTSTIGYSAICLPALLVLWGWVVLRRADKGRAVVITNYTLIFALLISTSFGMSRLLFPEAGPGMQWSGVVGDFLASVLAQLLGRVGGSILLFALGFVAVVFAADVDLQEVAERARSGWLAILDWLGRRRDEARDRRRARAARPESPEKAERPAPTPVKITRHAEEDESPRPAPRTIVTPPPAVSVATPRPASEEEPPERPLPQGDIEYVLPPVDLLKAPPKDAEQIDEQELKENADLLRATLAEFDVDLDSVSVTPGPVVTLYELVPASGVKISRIVSLENDMALKLAAKGIRIMAPIPGKSAVGVEIPNSRRSLVSMRSVVTSPAFKTSGAQLPIAMGKTISGEVFTDDLARMPHLLIAGSTGSGKSVGINTILASLFYRLKPGDMKLVIIDPKKIELAQYASLKNHFLAISPDVDEEIITTPPNAVMALRSVELEMERRYDRLAAAGVRNIVDYNDRVRAHRLPASGDMTHTVMPYLLVVIDELADLMITAAREVEEPIARLAQLARAVGIHLIVATQRPSVDVITGVIKANFSTRIAYQVASKTDSRTILDMNGAEQLLGNGDMLYLAGGSPKPIRLQNAYISPDEVDAIVQHISAQQGYASPFLLPSVTERRRGGAAGGPGDRDELFEEAARLIVRHQQGSVSLLQRRLKVGYSRAARLVDELEAAGIVGPFDGSKARAVLVETEEELDTILQG